MGLIEELEMNAEDAERWRQQLYAELGSREPDLEDSAAKADCLANAAG